MRDFFLFAFRKSGLFRLGLARGSLWGTYILTIKQLLSYFSANRKLWKFSGSPSPFRTTSRDMSSVFSASVLENAAVVLIIDAAHILHVASTGAAFESFFLWWLVAPPKADLMSNEGLLLLFRSYLETPRSSPNFLQDPKSTPPSMTTLRASSSISWRTVCRQHYYRRGCQVDAGCHYNLSLNFVMFSLHFSRFSTPTLNFY